MRTLTFTDEEYELLCDFGIDPDRHWPHAGVVVRNAIVRPQLGIRVDGEPPVTGHDTVWLMEHEG